MRAMLRKYNPICVVGRNGKLSVNACACTNVVLHVGVCGSAHCCGCVVNGSIAKAAFYDCRICKTRDK